MDTDQMVCAAARELRDGDIVFVGIGLPSLACNLALATHAPNLVLIYESGTIGTCPERIPLSIGDPALVAGTLMVAPMTDVFQCVLQRGHIDVGFLGAAQIDRFGRLNTTVIGKYEQPKVRLPGVGGASAIALHAKRTVIIARLERRTFVERLDFVSTAAAAPVRVITDRCILESDSDGELVVRAVHPGVTMDELSEHVGWKLRSAANVETIPPASPAVMSRLRDLTA